MHRKIGDQLSWENKKIIHLDTSITRREQYIRLAKIAFKQQ